MPDPLEVARATELLQARLAWSAQMVLAGLDVDGVLLYCVKRVDGEAVAGVHIALVAGENEKVNEILRRTSAAIEQIEEENGG